MLGLPLVVPPGMPRPRHGWLMPLPGAQPGPGWAAILLPPRLPAAGRLLPSAACAAALGSAAATSLALPRLVPVPQPRPTLLAAQLGRPSAWLAARPTQQLQPRAYATAGPPATATLVPSMAARPEQQPAAAAAEPASCQQGGEHSKEPL